MCFICDGGTQEQSETFIELTIIQHGWALRGVVPTGDPPDVRPWTYSIGLLESFNHPELVLTDHEYEFSGLLLNELGEEIRAGRDITKSNRFGAIFRTVHESYLGTEVMAAWHQHYGPPPAPGQVLQVVLPDNRHCANHQTTQADLSVPGDFPQPPALGC